MNNVSRLFQAAGKAVAAHIICSMDTNIRGFHKITADSAVCTAMLDCRWTQSVHDANTNF